MSVETFYRLAPELLDAAENAAAGFLGLARRAVAELETYDMPIGWRSTGDPIFPATSWVAAFQLKLASPNFFMRDHRIRHHLRRKWAEGLETMAAQVAGVSTFAAMKAMSRAPVCREPMTIQVVRFAPTSRGFLRDDDNSAFCTKQMSDALGDVGLIKSDRREWFTAAPLLQDVSPVLGFDVTLFVLRPAGAARLIGASNVHNPGPPAPRDSTTQNGGIEKGRTVPGRARRAGPRAVDA